jgi:hypothetical protein
MRDYWIDWRGCQRYRFRGLLFQNVKNLTSGEDVMPIELLVPIGIFVGFNIIMSTGLGGMALNRMVEGQKAAGKNLASTAAYEAPFISGQKK